MANDGYILVPSGLKPVHSFDLWGPIVDSLKLGEQEITHFLEIAVAEGISLENQHKIIADVRALLRGEPWATGERKREIFTAMSTPLQKHPELKLDYASSLQADGLYVLREIVQAGEEAIIFTSGSAPWVNEHIAPRIGVSELRVYVDQKTQPEAFQRVYAAETGLNRRVITHTADELPELEAAVKSGLFANGATIFVNRNNQISAEQAQAAGIDYYVNDLKQMGYTRLVQK